MGRLDGADEIAKRVQSTDSTMPLSLIVPRAWTPAASKLQSETPPLPKVVSRRPPLGREGVLPSRSSPGREASSTPEAALRMWTWAVPPASKPLTTVSSAPSPARSTARSL